MTSDSNYLRLEREGCAPIKAWVRGVPFDEGARAQLEHVARLPFIHKWVAAMPDVHLGIGATVGSVIPTYRAIVPAAVGVDIGCGMLATLTTLSANDLPNDLKAMRAGIERGVPHGISKSRGGRDRGSWGEAPARVERAWAELADDFARIASKHRVLKHANTLSQLGTLGSGNHFIEVCLDELERVWFLLHSGSRGVGNKIGTYFIELAKRDMQHTLGALPHRDLAYFSEGAEHFEDYVEAVSWAQRFAHTNRALMMQAVVESVRALPGLPRFQAGVMAVHCHHNYVQRERHYGAEVFVTRKGAVRAGAGELGIIPGSMGARSFIVRGKGHPESFESCSHGAGRAHSRTRARELFSIADHQRMTAHVECRKDREVIDETPAAYKPIDAVMEAQRDLVEIVHTLRQVVCVKG
ncbi:MAG: RtcB family protein [Planctomycetes bacterium]|nr:RtcB family protein [Planctomycetota bacterium]